MVDKDDDDVLLTCVTTDNGMSTIPACTPTDDTTKVICNLVTDKLRFDKDPLNLKVSLQPTSVYL